MFFSFYESFDLHKFVNNSVGVGHNKLEEFQEKQVFRRHEMGMTLADMFASLKTITVYKFIKHRDPCIMPKK